MTTYSSTSYSDPNANDGTDLSDVNDSGEVVGEYFYDHGISGVAAQVLSFVYDNGTYTDINDPSYSNTEAGHINDEGQVIGLVYNGSTQYEGFLYSNGTYTNLIDPNASPTGRTFASALNNNGEVVGSYDTGSQFNGYVYYSGNYTDLVAPGETSGGDTDPVAVNDSGEIAGDYSLNGSSPGVAFLWNGSWNTLVDPSAPAGADYFVTGMNNAGDVIGWWRDNTRTYETAFIYSNGNFTDLSNPDAPEGMEPTSINDVGQVAGFFFGPGETNIAFVDDNGVFTELNPPGVTNAQAADLNNDGQLIVSGEALTPDPDVWQNGSLPGWTIASNWNSGIPETNDYVTLGGGSALLTSDGGLLHSVENAGLLDVEDNGALETFAGFENSGILDVDTLDNQTASPSVTIGGVFDNSNALGIGANDGDLGADVSMLTHGFDNTGSISIDGGTKAATLTIEGPAGFGTAGVLTGSISLTGDAQIDFGANSLTSIAANSGAILSGAGAQINVTGIGGNSALTELGSNAGGLTLAGGAAVSVRGDFVNAGSLVLDNGGTGGGTSFAVAGVLTNNGQLIIGNSDISASDVVTAAGFATAYNATTNVQGGAGASKAASLIIKGNADIAGSEGEFTIDKATVEITGAVTGDGEFEMHSNATLVLGGADANRVYFANAFDLSGGGNVLKLTNPAADFGISLNLFAAGDKIDLTNVAYSASDEAVLRDNSDGENTLKIVNTAKNNAVLANLAMDEDTYSQGLFALSNDGAGGTDITFVPDSNYNFESGSVVFTHIPGQSGATAEEFDEGARNVVLGSKVYYEHVTGHVYKSEEADYDGGDHLTRVAFENVSGAPYSSYEYDYIGGVFDGSQFDYTQVPHGATYSSYETDYNHAGVFTGDKFFYTVSGQSYTGEEEDFDAKGRLTRVLLTGMPEYATSLELDYNAGDYSGYKQFYTDVPAQYTGFSGLEVDVSAANKVEKVVYSGLTGDPYTSLEADYASNGSLTGAVYSYTGITGETYNAYQLVTNGAGVALQYVFDLNTGGHAIVGLANGQTLTSLGDDKMTGGHANETFVFNGIYGADVITDFSSHETGASHDAISLPSAEFANFSAVTAAATSTAKGVMIHARDGDTLTLNGVTVAALAGLSADFTFHG